MRRLSFTILLALAITCVYAGIEKLSPSTKLQYTIPSAIQKAPSVVPSNSSVKAFISVENQSAIDSLKALGVSVNASFDGFVTATIPVGELLLVSDIKGISEIDVPKNNIHLLTDSARSLTGVNKVLQGYNLSHGYDGSGVVVGIIDTGIDFNHLAFRNSDGSTRIKRVYMPADSTGNSPVLEGDTLPGSEYTSPEQILQLTTDYTKQNHGSHTSGIAAGTTVNQYGGMAPCADLVLCGQGANLTEVDIVNSAKYISAYAKSVGKPCVVNLSIGNHDGPHDGKGYMSRALDEISEKYNTVFVCSAGNEGGSDLYIHKTLYEGKPLSSILSSPKSAQVDVWNSNTDSIQFQYGIYSSASDSLVYTSSIFKTDTVIAVNDSIMASWMTGEMKMASGINESNHKNHLLIDVSLQMQKGFLLILSFYSKEGDTLNAWETTGNSNFEADGIEGLTQGSDSCSISDMATGQNVISVGAYNERKQYIRDDGSTMICSYSAIGSIASFSSYGYDMNGVLQPFITAPGRCVISSMNSYTSNTTSAMTITNPEGRTNRWYLMSGTSMSSPCVAGIVALWLQANPNLSAAQVKDIMKTTAISDRFVKEGDLAWGNGKINAYAGLLQALSSGIDEVGLNHPSLTVFPNPVIDVAQVILPDNGKYELSIYNLEGRLVLNKQILCESNNVTLDLNGLSSGLYLLQVNAANYSQSVKLYKK